MQEVTQDNTNDWVIFVPVNFVQKQDKKGLDTGPNSKLSSLLDLISIRSFTKWGPYFFDVFYFNIFWGSSMISLTSIIFNSFFSFLS